MENNNLLQASIRDPVLSQLYEAALGCRSENLRCTSSTSVYCVGPCKENYYLTGTGQFRKCYKCSKSCKKNEKAIGNCDGTGSSDYTCIKCNTVPGCKIGYERCSTTVDSQCAQDGCVFGRYYSQGKCEICSPVIGCHGQVECSNSTDSKCMGRCANGTFKSSIDSKCRDCVQIQNCKVNRTGCTTDSDSRCSECKTGYYLTSIHTCNACMSFLNDVKILGKNADSSIIGITIDMNDSAEVSALQERHSRLQLCTGQITCTHGANAKCHNCKQGTYMGGDGTCLSCSSCPSGYFRDVCDGQGTSSPPCRKCDSASYCKANQSVCTNMDDALCLSGQCQYGYVNENFYSPLYDSSLPGKCVIDVQGPLADADAIEAEKVDTNNCPNGTFGFDPNENPSLQNDSKNVFTEKFGDCGGNSLLQILSITLENCQLRCIMNAKCQGISYRSTDNSCELKEHKCAAPSPVTLTGLLAGKYHAGELVTSLSARGVIAVTSTSISTTAQVSVSHGIFATNENIFIAGTNRGSPTSVEWRHGGQMNYHFYALERNAVQNSARNDYEAKKECKSCAIIIGCKANQVTCTGASINQAQCNECMDTYFITKEGKCEKCMAEIDYINTYGSNPSGYHDVQRWKLAYKGMQNCETEKERCSNKFDVVCTKCKAGYQVNGRGYCDKCDTSCPDGYYSSDTTSCVFNANNDCKKCTLPSNCTKVICSSSTSSTCTQCVQGFYLDNNGTCMKCQGDISLLNCGKNQLVSCTTALPQAKCTDCQSGYFMNAGQCKLCTSMEGCPSSSLYCTTLHDSICMGPCLPSYFRTTNMTCQSCLSKIESVRKYGGAPQLANVGKGLLPCAFGKVTCTTEENAKCSECRSGFYLNAFGYCEPCQTCSNGEYPSHTCENGSTIDVVCNKCVTPDGCKIGYERCSTTVDSQCAQDGCVFGRYYSQGKCEICSPVIGCHGQVECSNSTDSKCMGRCANGTFKSSIDSKCRDCVQIQNCKVNRTGCTTDSDSRCSECQDGYFLTPLGTCTPCLLEMENNNLLQASIRDPVLSQLYEAALGCRSENLRCTSSTSVYCVGPCKENYYLTGTGQFRKCYKCSKSCKKNEKAIGNCDGTGSSDYTCIKCNTVPGCKIGYERCSTTVDSQCAQDGCVFGRYYSQGKCEICSPVIGCHGQVECSNSTDSKCMGRCANGTFKSSIDSKCRDCVQIQNCKVNRTGCTTDSDSRCSECQDGYFLTPLGTCTPCLLEMENNNLLQASIRDPVLSQLYEAALGCRSENLRCTSSTSVYCVGPCKENYYLIGSKCSQCKDGLCL
eukprot:g4554.t1